MSNSIISEGKTTNEAIENGLKELKVSKEKVDIKVLEEENKKSFFSILTPRVVKVELTLKENIKSTSEPKKEKREYDHDIEHIDEAKKLVEKFLNEWLKQIDEKLEYSIKVEDYTIYVDIKGETAGILIGHRGETLNALQVILLSIVDRNINNKVKLILDIENYREKRAKTLEELAEKVSKTVLKTGRRRKKKK